MKLTYTNMNNSKHQRTIENWYEVRVDGEKVAAFAPISRDASTKAFKLIEDTRLDLYRGKQMQIVAIYSNPDWGNEAAKHQSEEVIHEENPTVIERDDFREMMPTAEEFWYDSQPETYEPNCYDGTYSEI